MGLWVAAEGVFEKIGTTISIGIIRFLEAICPSLEALPTGGAAGRGGESRPVRRVIAVSLGVNFDEGESGPISLGRPWG